MSNSVCNTSVKVVNIRSILKKREERERKNGRVLPWLYLVVLEQCTSFMKIYIFKGHNGSPIVV